MNIQPINVTNQTFKGTITIQNLKTGAKKKFLTNEQNDLELLKYFHKALRTSPFNFKPKEQVAELSKIVKQDLGEGLEYPKSNEFIGEFAAIVVDNNGKREALNTIAPEGFFCLEHRAPYIDVNLRV